MADDNDADLNLNADKQSGRTDPTQSETTHSVDISNPEMEERREQRRNGELTVDDIEDDELREQVKAAREEAGLDEEYSEDEDGGVTEADGPDKPDSMDEDSQRVQVSEGDDPMQSVAAETMGDGPDSVEEAKEAYADGEIDDHELDDAIEDGLEAEADEDEDDGGLMDGIGDEDVEDAMDMDLNIRDDIEPEHFDYEDQDFSVFGGYGQQANIEFNNTVFLLEQPGDREQEQLINEMGGGVDGEANLTEMLQSVIEATVTRPEDIETITSDWTPFERMGLGMQCMEFLGLDSLGNM